ncbi:2472_t:CDS:2 [Funneliformis geosporum]|uniref:2026_t:CDS:1 n=1 Tax=Funneliformis geosporum TaxID=1117311 RepID=A0A9W4SEF5_9GLOM|nr:2026_t:CDS:2 [Funneliformis geosporum]CAI2167478.1 2472_t:CDS:2 [Funneliformis geosporum]
MAPIVSPENNENNNFNLPVIISLVVVGVLMISVGIIINRWLKNKKNVLPLEKSMMSRGPTKKFDSITQLIIPSPAFNKETTLPVYRKSDTWERYLQMIQTPDKLNDVVLSMKIDNIHSRNNSNSTSNSL